VRKDAISTAALLDLLNVPATTATARRLAAVMRGLHFIPIKSRRLMPGGRAGNAVTRGWARPVRTTKSSPTTSNAGAAGLKRTGDDPMTFVLLKNYDQYAIVNDDADFIAGSVHPLNGREGPYRVRAHVGLTDRETTEIGVVNSLNEAIPTFLAHHRRNPPRWLRVHKGYWKDTLHVFLRVKQDQHGHWSACRDDYPLLRDGKPACFATHTDAQRAADAHELDLYPNAKAIDDGLSWQPDPEIDWRSIPHLVEGRARWQRSASSFLPD
jgi:hypothetical protein